MDILTTIVVLVPSVLSLCVSGIYAYIALKKAKEPPKDEAWETAAKLLTSQNHSIRTADDFAELYFQLKFVKEHPEDLKGFSFIEDAMEAKAGKLQAQPPESHSES